MSEIITFENEKFIIIPDDDKDYIIYVLENFESGKHKIFEINNDKVYYYLHVSTIKLPNGFWGFGYKSNFLYFDNKPVSGAGINGFTSELEALHGCLTYILKSRLTNVFYGKQILEDFEKFVNPKTLFDNISIPKRLI